MLNYDQKKDLKNKSETLSIKCVQRLEEKNSCVIYPTGVCICSLVHTYVPMYLGSHYPVTRLGERLMSALT